MKKYPNIKVLLIPGSARQVMPLMESFHNLGCQVTTYNSSILDMGYASLYPDKKILSYCNSKDECKTLELIEKELINTKHDIVIPLNDYIAILLAKNREKLSKYSFIAVNEWDVFNKASDKLETMKICMENKIPCPYTYSIDDTKKEELNKKKIQFPIVVKPRTGYAAVGFSVVENIEDLKNTLKKTQDKYGPCLIQEYIPQTDLQYKTEIYIDNKGSIKSAVVFAKIRWFPLDGGSSTLNVTVIRPDIINTCVRLLNILSWRGYADIDLIQDPRDGIAKVMEINPRITGSVKICYKAGVNFSQQIIQDYLNESVSQYLTYKEGIYLRYMHTDLLWFIKSSERFTTKPSWFNFINTTDQIFSLSDPLPFFTYSLQGLIKYFPEMKKRKR